MARHTCKANGGQDKHIDQRASDDAHHRHANSSRPGRREEQTQGKQLQEDSDANGTIEIKPAPAFWCRLSRAFFVHSSLYGKRERSCVLWHVSSLRGPVSLSGLRGSGGRHSSSRWRDG